MRSITIGLLAAAGIALASPAVAQGIYLGGPGVGVQIGGPGYYHDGPRYRERAYEYDRPGHRTYGYAGREPGCRTITIRRDDGSVRRIRRCD